MTEIRIRTPRGSVTVVTLKDWTEVLAIVGRHFCPDTHIGGPQLPEPEPLRKARHGHL